MKKRAGRSFFSHADHERMILETIDYVSKLMLSVHAMRVLLEHHGVLSDAEFRAVEKKLHRQLKSDLAKGARKLSRELKIAELQKLLVKHKGTIQ